MGRNALIDDVARHDWLYSVDLGGGVVTPGRFGPPNPAIKEAFEQIEFQGRHVLDVGCFEGQWAFEAEKRGAASVLATDYLVGDPRSRLSEQGIKELPTFRLAHTILGSRVEYRPDVSVYDVGRLGRRDFDVIVFCGVYYHLKHPLLALSRLRSVIREGGTLIVEGPVIEGPRESYARFFYGDVLADDLSNWWVPTLPCLLEWIECSYFEVVQVLGTPAPGRLATVLRVFREEGTAGVLRRVWARLLRRRGQPPSQIPLSPASEIPPVETVDRSRDARTPAALPAGGPSVAPGTATWRPPATRRTWKIVRRTVLARAVTRRDPHYALPDEDLDSYERG